MLSPTEKEQLKKRNSMAPKARGNLDYKVAQKVKRRLEEIDEIDDVIRTLPEKNVMRVIDDHMVASIFRLVEDMVRILGYSPIKQDSYGRYFAYHLEEIPVGQWNSKDYKVQITPPTAEDVARYYLLEGHVRNLRPCFDPDAIGRTMVDNIGFRADDGADIPLYPAQVLYRKWKEPNPEK